MQGFLSEHSENVFSYRAFYNKTAWQLLTKNAIQFIFSRLSRTAFLLIYPEKILKRRRRTMKKFFSPLLMLVLATLVMAPGWAQAQAQRVSTSAVILASISLRAFNTTGKSNDRSSGVR